ncbi:hypothetical protein CIB95_00190 [Lottiidibacillus patelloidae]|uniref:Uncharacterized protein n=1 Tax=Lottiidibacillus patelloidae TaxID=2670334 RepID=A0A263BWF2_9BACI|nr:hypothetical protein CIB95_00190 [Lottiidibacillus patelloidae]
MPIYKGSVKGHILNVSGYDIRDSSSEQIRLTDPYDQGDRGVPLGNVWHPLSGVYMQISITLVKNSFINILCSEGNDIFFPSSYLGGLHE